MLLEDSPCAEFSGVLRFERFRFDCFDSSRFLSSSEVWCFRVGLSPSTQQTKRLSRLRRGVTCCPSLFRVMLRAGCRWPIRGPQPEKRRGHAGPVDSLEVSVRLLPLWAQRLQRWTSWSASLRSCGYASLPAQPPRTGRRFGTRPQPGKRRDTLPGAHNGCSSRQDKLMFWIGGMCYVIPSPEGSIFCLHKPSEERTVSETRLRTVPQAFFMKSRLLVSVRLMSVKKTPTRVQRVWTVSCSRCSPQCAGFVLCLWIWFHSFQREFCGSQQRRSGLYALSSRTQSHLMLR